MLGGKNYFNDGSRECWKRLGRGEFKKPRVVRVCGAVGSSERKRGSQKAERHEPSPRDFLEDKLWGRGGGVKGGGWGKVRQRRGFLGAHAKKGKS